MKTEKLYYQDPFLREFIGKVLSCEPGKSGWTAPRFTPRAAASPPITARWAAPPSRTYTSGTA